MDDYSINSLTESKNEWCARLVSILTHSIIVGVKSIFDEAIKLCIDNDEENKYLMTFQNLLSQIPQWNPNIIETERKRIELSSGCKYLEELITCVHIIQLKALTCVRVGQKQKKIDIDMPSVDKFIHQIYTNSARKLYSNIYLFEKNVLPLNLQKNNRDLEILVKEAILLTIRDNIPVEQILRVYMEETEEQEMHDSIPKEVVNDISYNKVTEMAEIKTKSEVAPQSPQIPKSSIDINKPSLVSQKESMISSQSASISPQSFSISADNSKQAQNIEQLGEDLGKQIEIKRPEINFSNIDSAIDANGKTEDIIAPKDLETLKTKATLSSLTNNDNDDDDKLNIGDDVQLELDTIQL